MRLAFQISTFKKQAKKDLLATLADIKALGFRAVELSDIPWTEENIALIKTSGLHVSGIMLPLSHIQKDREGWVGRCKSLRCSRLIVNGLPFPVILGGLVPLRTFISHMNNLSLFLQSRGIKLCFYHHASEFKKIQGKTRMDYLLDECRLPIRIIADTYWLAYAHQPMVEFYNRLGFRLEGFHLRDFTCQYVRGKKKNKPGPLGSGCVDWPLICGYAYKTSYGALVSHAKHPEEDIRQSLAFLRQLIIKESR